MAVTIKEIAQSAGISIASVSRALNGMPGVSPRTRRRVERLARDLGYVPDAQAQALVSGRLPFIALVVPDITNPFFPAMARGAEEAAYEAGYSLLLVDTNWNEERAENALGLLSSRRVAGLLLSVPMAHWAGSSHWETLKDKAVMAGLPSPNGSCLPSVEVDDIKGGAAVGHHLVEQGFSRIAYIAGPEDDPAAKLRLAGIEQAISHGGATASIVARHFGQWTEEWGTEAARLVLERTDADAIFAANDLLALGALQVALEMGRKPGQDLAIVGYDNIDAVARCTVPLTSVDQPTREVGRQAVKRLIAIIEGKVGQEEAQSPPHPTLTPTLICRASTLGPSTSTKP